MILFLKRYMATYRFELGSLFVICRNKLFQEEMKIKDKKLQRFEKELHAAKTEVQDLQSEFEREREDLLETIRRQDQQLKLATQILDKTHTLLRPSCNYYNLDKIRSDAVWDDDNGCWLLPKVQTSDTLLPGDQQKVSS